MGALHCAPTENEIVIKIIRTNAYHNVAPTELGGFFLLIFSRVPPSRALLLLTEFRGGDTAQHPKTFHFFRNS
jgi:hypothetical protein